MNKSESSAEYRWVVAQGKGKDRRWISKTTTGITSSKMNAHCFNDQQHARTCAMLRNAYRTDPMAWKVFKRRIVARAPLSSFASNLLEFRKPPYGVEKQHSTYDLEMFAAAMKIPVVFQPTRAEFPIYYYRIEEIDLQLKIYIDSSLHERYRRWYLAYAMSEIMGRQDGLGDKQSLTIRAMNLLVPSQMQRSLMSNIPAWLAVVTFDLPLFAIEEYYDYLLSSGAKQ